MQRVDRRAEVACIIGICLQGLFFGLLLVLFKSNNSPATLAESWHLLAGVGIWLMIVIELYQERLAWQQRRELEDLERDRQERVGGSQSVFEGLSGDEPLPMERRLRLVKRWIVPIGTLVNAGILVLLASRLMKSWWPMAWLTDALEGTVKNQPVTLAIVSLVALVCFVISRYTLGLSKTRGWRVLRAGTNYLMGNALACFALAIVLAASHAGADLPERILARIVPIVMLILSVEMVLNLILNTYRPRVPGEEYRAVYESRLLGLFSEPEGLMRSIAQTIDYQFGFKVSETWFYQLLQRAIVSLLLFGVGTLYLLSTIVIVRPGEQAVVLHFGKAPSTVLPEGLHLKWPWPIDKVQIYPVSKVRELKLGHGGESMWEDVLKHAEPILWTVEHVEGGEFQLLVATTETQLSDKAEGPGRFAPEKKPDEKPQATLSPVSILAGAVVIFYNIKAENGGLLDYIAHYEKPETVLEAIGYREWAQYMASVDPMAVMTVGRNKMSEALRLAIQREVDDRRLGLNIIRVAVLGLHPPVDVAKAYEEAINARQEKEALIWKAKGEENEQLPLAKASEAEIISEAKSYEYRKTMLEKAKAQRFNAQLKSYQTAPQVFFLRNYLDMLVSATEKIRKFIVAVDHPEKVLLIMDEKEKVPAGLLGLGQELSEEMTRQEKEEQ